MQHDPSDWQCRLMKKIQDVSFRRTQHGNFVAQEASNRRDGCGSRASFKRDALITACSSHFIRGEGADGVGAHEPYFETVEGRGTEYSAISGDRTQVMSSVQN
jgi:hypothetical protein